MSNREITTDIVVFRQNHPPSPPNLDNPLFVSRVDREVVVVNLDVSLRCPKRRRHVVLTERAIDEEDEVF